MWIRSLLIAAAAALTIPMGATAQEARLVPYSGLFCQSSLVGSAIGTTFQTEGIGPALRLASYSIGLGQCARYDVSFPGRSERHIASWVRAEQMLSLYEVEIVNVETNQTMVVYVFDVVRVA